MNANETKTRNPKALARDAAYAAYASYCETRDRLYKRAYEAGWDPYTYALARIADGDAYRAYLSELVRITGSTGPESSSVKDPLK